MSDATKLTAEEVEAIRQAVENETPPSPEELLFWSAPLSAAEMETFKDGLAQPFNEIREVAKEAVENIAATWEPMKAQLADMARHMAEVLAAREKAAANFYRLAFDLAFADNAAEKELALAEREVLEALTEKAARDLDADFTKRLRAGSSPEERRAVVEEIRAVYGISHAGAPAWPDVLRYLHDGDAPDLDPVRILSPTERLVRGLAACWPDVLAGWREKNAAKIGATTVVRNILASAASPEEQDPDAKHPEAAARLAAATERYRAEILPQLATPPGDDLAVELARCRQVGEVEVHECVETLAAQLEKRLGGGGKTAAANMRKTAGEVLAAYRSQAVAEGVEPPSPPWARWRSPVTAAEWIAAAVWDEVVRPELERARTLRPRIEALPLWVADSLTRAMLPGNSIRAIDGKRVLVSASGELLADVPAFGAVPALNIEAAEILLHNGVPLLGSVDSHRYLFWQMATTLRQAEAYATRPADCPQPNVIDIVGGWDAVEEVSGVRADSARRISYAEAYLRWPMPDGSRGNMIILRETPGHRGQKARVRMEIATFLDGSLNNAADGSAAMMRAARKRVALIDPDTINLVGRRNHHGQQITYAQLVMVEMRRRAVELLATGGVYLPPDLIAYMAATVGLTPALLPRVMDALGTDGDRPALLAEVDRHRYTLAPSRKPALDLMLEGARMESDGQRHGIRAATNKGRRLSKGRKSSTKTAH